MPHPMSSVNWPGGQGSVSISLHAWKQICIAEAVCCVLVAAWLLSNGCVCLCAARGVCERVCAHVCVCVGGGGVDMRAESCCVVV